MRANFAVLLICVMVLAACGVSIAERNGWGNAEVARGDYTDAIDIFRMVQVEDPDNEVLYFNAAFALSANEDFEGAILALNQAIKQGDSALIAKSYHNIGNIYFNQSQYTQAIDAYKESLRYNPNDDETRYNLELAILFELPPTPTALELQTESEEDFANPTATPSPNPVGEILPTPTPTPTLEGTLDPSETPVAGFQGDMSGPTPGTPLPRDRATMTIEEARRQLDVIEQNQRTLREFQQSIITPQVGSAGRGW